MTDNKLERILTKKGAEDFKKRMTDNKLERILTKEGAEDFKKLLNKRGNSKINVYLNTILSSYFKELDKTTVQSELTDSSWALQRAYRDGGKYYLQQLLTLFKE